MKQITFVQHGADGGPQTSSDRWNTIDAPPLSRGVILDVRSIPRFVALHAGFSAFDLLPAATATAGKDAFTLTLGTGTEVVTRASKGGINLQTQASSPATADNALIIGAVGSSLVAIPLRAATMPRFSTRVNLTQITNDTFFAGMDETATGVDPTANAGDGAGFLFNGASLVTTTGVTTTTNWILTSKNAGADTFIDSGVPVVAGQDYELEIQWNADLTTSYYINGTLVGTGAANLSGAVPNTVVGIQVTQASGTVLQKDFDCRYVRVERFIG